MAQKGSLVHQEGNSVNCLNSRAIIEYIRHHFPDRLKHLFVDLPSPWGLMDSPELYLSDENNWINSSVVVQLFKNARAISGRDDVAFEIGYESILRREFSYIQKLFITYFSSPRNILRRLNQLNTKFNTTKVIEVIFDAPGRAQFRWHWKSGISVSKDLCEYNKGIYSAVPTLWGLPPAKVEESSCYFQGGAYCESRITWNMARGVAREMLSRMFTRKSTLLVALEEIDRDKELLRQKFDELARLNRELVQNVTMLKAINEASRAIVSAPDTNEVLQKTMTPIIEVFGFDRAMIMLVDKERENLEYRFGVGAATDAMDRLKGYKVPLNREQNLMIRVLRGKRTELIRDVKAAGLNPTNRILSDFRPSSFIVCPLITEEETIGILGVDRRGEEKSVTPSDAEFLSIFANNIATALQRARLDEELKGSYVASVGALVKAIEEKDTYTRGHSERVARMVVEMAKALGLPDQEIEYLRFGSILHDVGKIGIPESIVRSPKALTTAEYKIIQKHPLKGVEILQPISFIRNHMYLIRSHHERWDGKGYPDQLAGDAIPLGAQMVAVADAFDAMTSSRPYRKGMPPKQAAREIRKNAGTQFSKHMAEVFWQVFEKNPSIQNTGDLTKS